MAAPAGPYSLAITGGLNFGLFFATHGKLTLSIGRTLWDRIELSAAFRFASGQEYYGLEETVRLGVLLPLSRRWTLLLAWRLGYAHFCLAVPDRERWVGGLVAAFEPELSWRLTPEIELRLTPAAVSGYWNEVWGMGVETSAGLAYRF